jgi:hypothetical protein
MDEIKAMRDGIWKKLSSGKKMKHVTIISKYRMVTELSITSPSL